MKKITVFCMAVVMMFCVTACSNTQTTDNNAAQTDVQMADKEQVDEAVEEETSEPDKTVERTLPEPELGDTRIRFSWDDKEVVVRMIDNTATQSLIEKLPLSIDFEDYVNRQKSCYLPEELDWDGSPNECDCFNGDLTYYAPWGVLSFFYLDHGYVDDLVPLGTIESGLENLRAMDGVKVTIELAEQ